MFPLHTQGGSSKSHHRVLTSVPTSGESALQTLVLWALTFHVTTPGKLVAIVLWFVNYPEEDAIQSFKNKGPHTLVSRVSSVLPFRGDRHSVSYC